MSIAAKLHQAKVWPQPSTTYCITDVSGSVFATRTGALTSDPEKRGVWLSYPSVLKAWEKFKKEGKLS